MKRLLKSFGYAWNGIRSAVQSEKNMHIHLFFVVAVIICGFIFHISRTEWMLCIGCFGMVMGAELINTAIESIVDLISPERKPLAGKAKDIAAGAVLITAIAAAVIGLLIFVPKVCPCLG